MRIEVAENIGFCPGVQHAIDTALSQSVGTYVLGEIIHNAGVVDEMGKNGLVTVDSLDKVPDGGAVIFRSHGVPLSCYEECERRGIRVVDCTCSYVNRTQRIVKKLHDEGKAVVIVGDPSHPEVIGLQGWCDGKAYVIEDEKFDFDSVAEEKVGIVCQTTFPEAKFDEIVKNIKNPREKKVEVFETICYTTKGRQKETEAMSKRCEAMLVIGDENSSNTNKLFDIARMNCGNVYRLSNSADFDVSVLKKYKSVGIVTGASTSTAQTREVLNKMEEKEAQTAATTANSTMADVVARIDNESKFKRGQIITATISQANEDEILILLPFSKKEIPLSKDELDCEEYRQSDYEARIGDSIDLLVVDLKPQLKLSEKMIRIMKEEDAMEAEMIGGKEFSVVCDGHNKGGLTGKYGTYSVFVPAKEIRPGYVNDLEKYVGKTLRLRALEVKKDRKREIIASQRVILQEEKDARDAVRAEKEDEFFSTIQVGDVVEGKVERITSFGAFVSVRGFDCLAHISDLSWSGCNKVEDVLEIGKTYKFKVLNVKKEARKVSIGYKQLQPQPWDTISERYAVGDTVHGKVVRLASFGAFVEVEKGVDGLVHVSQISHERIEQPSDVLSVGDEIDAKIIVLDTAEKKMNLSIKALLPEPERERKPRREKEYIDEDGTSSSRRGNRNARKPAEEDEISDWNEGSLSADTSIADLMESAMKSKESK